MVGIIRHNKTQSNKQRAREWDRLTPAPAPALFIYHNKTRPTRKTQGAKNKPIQARNGATLTNTQATRKKPRKTQITSPQGQQRGKR